MTGPVRLRWLVPMAGGLTLSVGVGLVLSRFTAAATLAGGGILLLCLLHPFTVFQGVLVLRSSLDLFTDVVFMAGPLKLNLAALASLVLDVVGLVFVAGYVKAGRRIRLTPIGVVFLAWLAALPFWVLQTYLNFGAGGALAIREWIRLCSLFIVYLIAVNVSGHIGESTMVRCLFASLAVPLAGVLAELAMRTGHLSTSSGRLSSTMVHPNALALFLVFFIALTLRELGRATRRWPWLALLGLELLGLVMTFSVSGMIMLVVLLPVMVLGGMRGRARIYACLTVVCALAVFFVSDYGGSRIATLRDMPGIDDVLTLGQITDSWTWRLYHWKLLTAAWLSRPILGFGLQTCADGVSPWRAAAHNDYLRYLVETGAMGTLLFLALMVTVGRCLLAEVRRARSAGKILSLALVAFSVYCAWLVGSFAGNFISSTAFQYAFWTLLGTVMGPRRPSQPAGDPGRWNDRRPARGGGGGFWAPPSP